MYREIIERLMCYEEISKLLGWRVATTFLGTLDQARWSFVSGWRNTVRGQIVTLYRDIGGSSCRPAGLSLLFLTTGDLSPVMDERTQTLPTAQYRIGVREDMDATRAIRNAIRFRIYVSTVRYCHTGRNEIAAGNTWRLGRKQFVNTRKDKISLGPISEKERSYRDCLLPRRRRTFGVAETFWWFCALQKRRQN